MSAKPSLTGSIAGVGHQKTSVCQSSKWGGFIPSKNKSSRPLGRTAAQRETLEK